MNKIIRILKANKNKLFLRLTYLLVIFCLLDCFWRIPEIAVTRLKDLSESM